MWTFKQSGTSRTWRAQTEMVCTLPPWCRPHRHNLKALVLRNGHPHKMLRSPWERTLIAEMGSRCMLENAWNGRSPLAKIGTSTWIWGYCGVPMLRETQFPGSKNFTKSNPPCKRWAKASLEAPPALRRSEAKHGKTHGNGQTNLEP